MVALKLIMLVVALVALFVAAMSIRLLCKKNGRFSGGSCSSSPTLNGKKTSCGCGGTNCSSKE